VTAAPPPSPPRETRLRGWRGFTARYGWRAYAVPILLVITVAALVARSPDTSHPAAAAHAAGHRPAKTTSGAADDTFLGPTAQSAPPSAPVTIRRITDADACATNQHAQLALVSISEQHAWMCDKHRQVFSTAVTTGSHVHHDQTPTGTWVVQSRQRDRYLVGPGYRDWVNYWVPFNGDFGFHDATWQKMAFGSPDYTTRGSHGCVHLPMPSMKWFFQWATVNKTVVTVQA
jgi:hypothetical protein